jgi:hypothetical protein
MAIAVAVIAISKHTHLCGYHMSINQVSLLCHVGINPESMSCIPMEEENGHFLNDILLLE